MGSSNRADAMCWCLELIKAPGGVESADNQPFDFIPGNPTSTELNFTSYKNPKNKYFGRQQILQSQTTGKIILKNVGLKKNLVLIGLVKRKERQLHLNGE